MKALLLLLLLILLFETSGVTHLPTRRHNSEDLDPQKLKCLALACTLHGDDSKKLFLPCTEENWLRTE